MRVTGRGANFAEPFSNIEDRYVEGPSSKVEYHHGLVLLLIHAVGKSGGGGFVDDAQDIQPCYLPRVLRRLALGVVEIGRNRYDGLGHLLAEPRGGVRHKLAEHLGAYLLRSVLFSLYLHLYGVVRSLKDGVGNYLHL